MGDGSLMLVQGLHDRPYHLDNLCTSVSDEICDQCAVHRRQLHLAHAVPVIVDRDGKGRGGAWPHSMSCRQRMGRHRGRGLGCPGQFATQDLRLQLQIKDDRLPNGIVQRVHLSQRLHQGIRIRQQGGGVGSSESAGVDSGKGQPGHRWDCFVGQGSEQQLAAAGFPIAIHRVFLVCCTRSVAGIAWWRIGFERVIVVRQVCDALSDMVEYSLVRW